MGDHRRVNWNRFPNKQQFNTNSFTNIPPPPSIPPPPPPPRFPPPNIISVSPSSSFSLPPRFDYPLYPEQSRPTLPPPVSGTVYSSAWDHALPPSTGNLVYYPPPPLTEQVPQDSDNAQDWVDHWARDKGKLNVVKRDLKINAIKEKLDAAFKLVRELENSSRTLGVMVKTVSSAEWEQKCSEVEDKKKQLMGLFSDLKLNEEEFKLLKEKLSKRKKKRARLRRQSEKMKKRKEEERVKTQTINLQIDNWQKEMQEGVERVKREEDLKKEADAVLWGVTQKKTEAKRQVAMLSALLNLRSVRVARLTAAGRPVSQSQIDTFNTVIERLKSMWTRHVEECQLEEQALRGMLGVDSQPPTDAVRTHKKLVLNEWETAIFGSIGTLESTLKEDELINIRRAWDQFAVSDPSLLASAIPPGYVLPTPPSSEQWRSFLKY